MKTTASAIAILAIMALSPTAANAACDVKHGTAANVILNNSLGHLETDCASAADVTTLQGTVAGHTTDIGNLQSTKADKVTSDGDSTTTIGAQGVIVEDVAGNKSGLAAEGLVVVDKDNPATDGTIVTGKGVKTTGEVEIQGTKVKQTLDNHTGTLALHTTQIAQGVAHDVIQDGRLGSLETVTAAHEMRLNAQDALLSQHSAKLDEHSKGLAIAMAMPDAWLSDKKRFGVFGAIGGFDGEAALGVAAIGRLDETFSLNAKFGSDMDFEQFGWQVGVGAQW